LSLHLFSPRILKRASISRNEESGYPNRLKNSVTKSIVPKKRTNCLDDPVISPVDDFSGVARVFRKSRSKKRPDKNMSNIPRMRGNNPVPDLRKVPMGMLKERRVVSAPKRKITTPAIISFLFKKSSLESISHFKFQIADFRNITLCFNS
jgi:hypothetical protein